MNLQFNPQQTSDLIKSKSFLKNRDPKRQTTGSLHFRDNKIRSCSYVKQTQNALKAVPFYDKRDNTLYPTPSKVINSWNSKTYVQPNTVYAGMGNTKPLTSYNPSLSRSMLQVPSFRPAYTNSSKFQIGERHVRDTKHYVTTYGNSFIHKSGKVPTNHPGIQAFRNKWVRSRLAQ